LMLPAADAFHSFHRHFPFTLAILTNCWNHVTNGESKRG
jgi:hypothetical protein